MKSVPSVALILVLVLASCSFDEEDQRRAAWNEVQNLKASYLSAPPQERLAAKQRWADGVREFLHRWPDHPGAMRTWNDLQLDYAEQLEANGHYPEAERHYESLVQRAPDQPRATEGLERIQRRRSLSRRDFQELRKGMTTAEVADRFGLPRPGWDRRAVVEGEPVESWYYRDATGTIRGVHFKEGTIFEVDLD